MHIRGGVCTCTSLRRDCVSRDQTGRDAGKREGKGEARVKWRQRGTLPTYPASLDTRVEETACRPGGGVASEGLEVLVSAP
jgi:hypothetical protein